MLIVGTVAFLVNHVLELDGMFKFLGRAVLGLSVMVGFIAVLWRFLSAMSDSTSKHDD